ncbi:MAG: DUF998 domain-containing protein [Pseudomonadota bacterium]
MAGAATTNTVSIAIARIARVLVLATLAAHVVVLLVSDVSAASTPISQLSRGPLGWLHTLGLVMLGAAWLLITPCLWVRERSALWRAGCVLIALSVPVLYYVAYYFATASDAELFSPNANDPLSVLASSLGVAMGAIQPGLRRINSRIARSNLLVLIVWIGLIPVIPFIEPGWLGAYERCVGALMLIWTLLLTEAAAT